MTPDQLDAFCERFVAACERMALALEGLHETQKRKFSRQFPERGEVREAVLTRVPSEEDRIREIHGGSDAPLSEWLSDVNKEEEEEEFIGVRERAWLNAQHQEPEDAQEEG